MTAPPTRRVSHGKGHSYFLDGAKEIGVTTALGEGFPKPALINWAQGQFRIIDFWGGGRERVRSWKIVEMQV